MAETEWSLVAVVSGEMPEPPPGTRSISHPDGSLSAILSEQARRSRLSDLIKRDAKSRAARHLLERQKLLETLHARGTVLPARPGQMLAPEAAAPVLIANRTALLRQLAELAEREQYQVILRWDPALALQRFRDAPELCDLMTSARDLTRSELGRRLKASGEALRHSLSLGYRQTLLSACEDLIDLPLETSEMLLNQSCLTRRGGVDLERALEEIDGSWPDGFKISMIGPSPAISFTSLEILRPSADDAAAARARIGLARDADARPENLRHAYRAALSAAHPDLCDDRAEQPLAEVQAAYKLLCDLEDARACLDAAGFAAPPAPPLVGFHRDGMASPEAPRFEEAVA